MARKKHEEYEIPDDEDEMEEEETTPTLFDQNQKESVELLGNYGGNLERSIYEIQFEDALKNLEVNFRSLIQDPETGQYYRYKKVKPMINDQGVSDLMSVLRSHLHKGTPMTKITNQMALIVVVQFMDAVIALLEGRYLIYEIDVNSLEVIHDMIRNNVLFAILRAVDADEKKYRAKALGFHEDVKQKADQGFISEGLI